MCLGNRFLDIGLRFREGEMIVTVDTNIMI